MPRTTSEERDIDSKHGSAKSRSPFRYLIAGLIFGPLSALALQCSQHVFTRLFCGYTALISAIIFALAMAISICAVVSPGMRDAVEGAGRWWNGQIASGQRTSMPAWIAPAASISMAFVLYYRTLNIGFLSDDWGYLQAADENHVWLRQGGFWRPVVNISFWLDDKIWGHRPLMWHVENVAIYGITGFFVYLLTRRFTKDLPFAGIAGVCATLLYLVMPGHVEVVNWLCDRGDLYGTLFTLAGLLAYLRYRDNKRARSFALTAALLTLGLLSKEAMAAVPIAVIVAELWGKRWANAVMMALLEAGYIAARAHVIGKLVGGYTDTLIVGTNMTISIMFHLLDEFPFPTAPLVLAGLVYRLRSAQSPKLRSITALAACIVLYLAAVAPVLSISPGPEGNRYIFLPSALSCAILGIAMAYLMTDRRRVYVFASCIIALGAAAQLPSIVGIANGDWVKAGDFTKASIARAKAAGSTTILPDDRIDSIGRAYIWRNCWEIAVKSGEE